MLSRSKPTTAFREISVMARLSRRSFLSTMGAAAVAAPAIGALGIGSAQAASGKALTIAYNVDLPSWDPTVGLSAVNPTIQSIYKSVFDQYIDQNPNLWP
jgi:peptide/nickel transport system substrate-binding protein